MLFGRSGALGIDVGTTSVHVAHVGKSGGDLQVVNFGGLELPPGAVREGEIIDVDAVASAIESIIGQAKIREKDAYIGVANQRVVVRQVELPWMEESELRESLRFQVQEHIPIPVEDAELDFFILEEIGDEDEQQRMLRVLLVAASKDMVAAHVDAVRRAGLRPQGVDLNPFAIIRAVGTESALDQGSEVLIDVGGGVTEIVIHRAGTPEFVRILVLGGDDITDALETAMNLSRGDAEELKRQTGLRTEDGSQQATIVKERASAFIDEIRNSLDYYSAQMGGATLSRVRLAGGGALLDGLPERLSDVLGLPVEVANPFERWPATDTVYGERELAAVGPTLATAIGLAVGGAG